MNFFVHFLKSIDLFFIFNWHYICSRGGKQSVNFFSFWVYNINHSILKTMIDYISLLLTFISLEFVTSHLPKAFIFLFCLLSSRYLFLLTYLLVFPLILEQIYISNVSTDMYSRQDFKKWWNLNQSNILHYRNDQERNALIDLVQIYFYYLFFTIFVNFFLLFY